MSQVVIDQVVIDPLIVALENASTISVNKFHSNVVKYWQGYQNDGMLSEKSAMFEMSTTEKSIRIERNV